MGNRISWKRALTPLTVLMAMALAFSGCGQKRSKKFAQGTGEHLYGISDFDGKTFTLKTGEKLFKGETSRADKLDVLDGFTGINSLDAVAFEMDSPLLEGLDLSDFHFYGKENHEYKMMYKLTDSTVILSKVAPREDIPSQEMTYAEDLGNGEYSVAMMGLPLSYFTVEEVKDPKGKNTRQLTNFPKQFKKEASHFQINRTGIEYFNTEPKLDLFKADFFNPTDEWYYTKTLIGRPVNSDAVIGAQLAALRMKFVKTNNSILGVDLNIAPEQVVLDPEKTVIALEIPVEWADFKLTTSGAKAFLEEKKITNGTPGARFWANRAYGLLDFNTADRLQKSQTQENKLEKLQVSQDYISFTIYESSTGYTYKYSMVKAKKAVDGQILYADDKINFHLFADLRKVIGGALNTQTSDIEQLVRSKRIYPENGEIVFHITNNTPEIPAYIEAISDAVKAWDDAFVKADVGLRVRLANDRVEPGDVRYHKITFYGYEIDAGSLLGVGPSVGDERTGEIFSATTHIYLRGYREGLISSVRAYVRSKLGLYSDKGITGIPAFQSADDELLKAGALLTAGASIPDANVSATMATQYPEWTAKKVAKNLSVDPALEQKPVKAVSAMDLLSPAKSCSFAAIASNANAFKRIEETCLNGKTDFSGYLDRLLAANKGASEVVYNLEGEHDAVLSCANVMMKEQLFSTLVHELGHDFGLGHNFAGSSDSKNFPRTADGKVIFPYSSVMDYPDGDFDNFSQVGPYDVAAIRFLYGRKVETDDGEIVAIPRDKSIKATLAELGKKPHKYKVCNDIEAGPDQTDMMFDPLCARWDVGSSPVEVTNWAISQIHADYIMHGYIYNSRTMYRMRDTYFDRLRRIYEQWRYLIENRVNGHYLTAFSTDAEYQATVKKIVEEEAARGNTYYKEYYEASRKIYEFARDLAFQPIRFCVIQSEGQNPLPLEFMRLRSMIYESKNATVQTCDEAKPYIPELMATGFLGGPVAPVAKFDLIQAGTNLKQLELTLNPEEIADRVKKAGFEDWPGLNFGLNPIYSQGIMALKDAAVALLVERSPRLIAGVRHNFGPSMMDEPGNRTEIANLMRDRLLKGESWQRLGFKDLKGFIPSFAEARDFNDALLHNVLNLTDNPEGTGQFRAQFRLVRYDNFDINSGTDTIIDALSRGNSYWYNQGTLKIARKNTYAYDFLNKLNRMDQGNILAAYINAGKPLETLLVNDQKTGLFQTTLQGKIDAILSQATSLKDLGNMLVIFKPENANQQQLSSISIDDLVAKLKGGEPTLTPDEQLSVAITALLQTMIQLNYNFYLQPDQIAAFAKTLQTDLAAAAAANAAAPVDLMAVASGTVTKFFKENLGNTVRFEVAFASADPENFEAQLQSLSSYALQF